MSAYHVYFDAKEPALSEGLVAKIHEFMETQLRDNYAISYRLLHMTNKASFEDLPDYHLIVDYASDADLQSAFLHMKTVYREEPHLSIMKMAGTFKVAFSEDKK